MKPVKSSLSWSLRIAESRSSVNCATFAPAAEEDDDTAAVIPADGFSPGAVAGVVVIEDDDSVGPTDLSFACRDLEWATSVSRSC